MSVGAVNKQTGDRIPTAGMPAIDNALDLTSVNPVQNAVITAALAGKTDTGIVADDFDSTASYVIGNYCIKDGKLYRFKANHSGAWSASDVDEIQITGELATLKSGLTNKVDYLYYNKESSASEDDAIKDLYDSIDIYDKTVVGTLNYHGFWMFMALKYTGGSFGSIVLFRFDETAKFLNVYEGVKKIRSFTFGS